MYHTIKTKNTIKELTQMYITLIICLYIVICEELLCSLKLFNKFTKRQTKTNATRIFITHYF